MTGRSILLGALAMLTVQLPACSFSGSVETMLAPPRLTQEQEQIYQALQNAVGGQISLKYPKSGERLSAFTVVDLNGDGSDEAIVFYQAVRASEEENPLRVCLLAQQDGSWRAISEYPAAGAEIERIDVGKLGTNPRTNLIISYSVLDGAEHAASVYHYENGLLEQTLSVPYSTMAVRDLDDDGTLELFVTAGAKAPQPATVTVYALDRSGSYLRSQLDLPDSVTEVMRIAYGDVQTAATPLPMLYLDCTTGATTAQTVVLQYEAGRLSFVYSDSADRFPNTARPAGCQSMDIDGDGEIEIPVNTVFYGYSNAAEGSPLQMTGWYVCRNGLLIREHASYYSTAGRYVFVMPERWEQRVTAVTEDEEIVFYEIDRDQQLEDGSPVLREPLLRLAVVNDLIAADAMQAEGYTLLCQQDGNYYLGASLQCDSRLRLTGSELLFAMRVL